jgi:hypothetical protein
MSAIRSLSGESGHCQALIRAPLQEPKDAGGLSKGETLLPLKRSQCDKSKFRAGGRSTASIGNED